MHSTGQAKKTKKSVIASARSLGSGVKHRVVLDDRSLARIAGFIEIGFSYGFKLENLPDAARPTLPYYETNPEFTGQGHRSFKVNFGAVYDEAIEKIPDFEQIFECLCEIHKRRVKFARIKAAQVLPDIHELSHRSLLESAAPGMDATSAFMRLRKLLYDQDNRSGQEAAFLFMKVITLILGGKRHTGRTSPIRHYSSDMSRRSVDCIVEKDAYDFRARMTEAPSRRARFGDEVAFPRDCNISGYRPILLAFHQLPGERSEELVEAYLRNGGEAHIGPDAWAHLCEKAGPVMTSFIEDYLMARLESFSNAGDNDPDITIRIRKGRVSFELAKN